MDRGEILRFFIESRETTLEPSNNAFQEPQMKTLLQIRSSMFSAGGQSSQLAQQFVDGWRAANPDGQVITRDIGAQPVPHLTAERFQAFLAQPETRTPEQQAVAAYSDALIDELRQADEIVLGLPMYNFGVPSTLKAYFDHIARSGVTFKYTEKGPQGLITGKKAYVFAARDEIDLALARRDDRSDALGECGCGSHGGLLDSQAAAARGCVRRPIH